MLGVWLRHPRYVVGPIQEYEVRYGTGAALAGPGVCPEAHPDDPEFASDDRGRAAAVWAEREDCDAPREIRASLYAPTER